MKNNMQKIQDFLDDKFWQPEHSEFDFCCGIYEIGDFACVVESVLEHFEDHEPELYEVYKGYTKSTKDRIMAHALFLYIHRCVYHELDGIAAFLATTAIGSDPFQSVAETALKKAGFKTVRKFVSKSSGNLIRVWMLIKE